jgi:hypothetical protein
MREYGADNDQTDRQREEDEDCTFAVAVHAIPPRTLRPDRLA